MTRSGMSVTGETLSSMAWNDIAIGFLILIGICLLPLVLKCVLGEAKKMDEQYDRIQKKIDAMKKTKGEL